ncbi:hypothetical protein LCGC14_0378700 [marine sediment metagenome]|uniref:Uncharacterized protein n=1 Tax=marine sediment metagenome TaxID=412755 RepID=A0A0F9TL39_9ZZZZ
MTRHKTETTPAPRGLYELLKRNETLLIHKMKGLARECRQADTVNGLWVADTIERMISDAHAEARKDDTTN